MISNSEMPTASGATSGTPPWRCPNSSIGTWSSSLGTMRPGEREAVRPPGCLPRGLTFDRPGETLDPAVAWSVACELPRSHTELSASWTAVPR